jgi:hypothetical protein
LPIGIGYTNDPNHDRQRSEIVELELFYREQLTNTFQNMLRWWKLYHSQRDDQRKPEEQWRSNVFVPYPYSGVETKTASLVDILTSSDPPIQAEGVGDEDEGPAKKCERLLDYTLRVNEWRGRLDGILREACIQGTALFKSAWRHEQRRVKLYPSSEQCQQFELAVEQAVSRGASPPPQDPQGFAQWQMEVLVALQIRVPPNPYSRVATVSTFQAPKIERVSIFDTRFDPGIDTIQGQHCFIQRVVRPKQWVIDRAGDDPNLPFDEQQVKSAMNGWGEERWSEQEKEIAEMMGVELDSNDPYYRDRIELWEVFRPDHPEAPYTVWLNRQACINKDVSSMPYGHGEIPITAIRNVPVPGQLLGISEMQPAEKLYYEMNTLRDLRIDATTLATMPVFGKLAEMGMPDIVRMIRPGTVWNLPRLDGWKKLTEGGPDSSIWRELAEIKGDIDETNSTPSQVRGGASQVGRVSATETERRLSQALLRMKTQGIRVEEELHGAVKQWLWLWYQFGDEELMVRVGGDGPDPYVQISKDELLEAFDIDFRFRGASRAANRELITQQLMTFATTFGAALKPHRVLALASRIYEGMGIKGRQEIIPDQDIAEAKLQYEQQVLMQQQAAAVQQAQLAAGQPVQETQGAPAQEEAPPQEAPPQ